MDIPNSKMMLVDKCKLINQLCCNNLALKFFVKMILNKAIPITLRKIHNNTETSTLYTRNRVKQ